MKRPYRQKDLGAKTRTMAETMKEYHPVKYKDVNIGQVTAVQLTSDSSRVEVTAKIDWSADPVELPVTPSELTDIEQKVVGILAKLDKLPYEAIGADLTKALVSLDQMLKDADKAVNRMDAEVTPELKTTLEELRRTIATADGVLKSTNAILLGTDAPGQQEIARAARSLRILTDFLERHPEALIRGKTGETP